MPSVWEQLWPTVASVLLSHDCPNTVGKAVAAKARKVRALNCILTCVRLSLVVESCGGMRDKSIAFSRATNERCSPF